MRIRFSLVVVVLVVALAGCAAPPSGPTPPPTATAPASTEPPVSRLDRSCDDLLAPETVDAFAGRPTDLMRSGDQVPRSWWDVVIRQSGTSSCAWGPGPDETVLSFTVVPDAADFYSGNDQDYTTYYERYDEFGDDSLHTCAYGQCTFTVLVADYLVTGYASRPDLMDELDLLPVIEPVLRELVASVREAIPSARPAWTPPAGVLPGWGYLCADGVAPIGELAALAGLTGAFSTGGDWDAGTAAAFHHAAPSWCQLVPETGPGYLGVAVVEGGGWVADAWMAEPPTDWRGTPFESAAVDGIGTVFVQQEEDDYHTALFTLEGTLVWVSTTEQTREEFLDLVSRLAEYLAERAA